MKQYEIGTPTLQFDCEHAVWEEGSDSSICYCTSRARAELMVEALQALEEKRKDSIEGCGEMKIDIEAFKKAVAEDVDNQYKGVDYLQCTIPQAMDRHKELIVVDCNEATERDARAKKPEAEWEYCVAGGLSGYACPICHQWEETGHSKRCARYKPTQCTHPLCKDGFIEGEIGNGPSEVRCPDCRDKPTFHNNKDKT